MNKKLFSIFSLSLMVMFLFAGGNFVFAQKPPTLAFYYAWFDENTWASGQPAGIPAPTYRSADPMTIARQVSQAKNAGIDAFVQSWYGPQVEYNQTETNFRILLDTALQSGFYAAVDVEVMGPFFDDAGSVQNALASLLATHINHPAYFRFDGKPVIFFWRQQRFDVETWVAIRQAIDPLHTTYWIAEGIDLSYQSVFDGNHLYSIAWANNPASELNKWHPRLQKIEAEQGSDKLWIATAMPGYNDLNLHRADSFSRSRDGGAYYRQTWQAALATHPDMIVITSFNEWLEGTQIEPDVDYGNFYLDLTRELIDGSVIVATPDEIFTAVNDPATPEEALSAPTPSLNDGIYTVKSGDTLLGIAISFGQNLENILAVNELGETDILAIGQKILIPNGGEERSMKMREKRSVFLNYYRIPEHY